MYLKRAVWAVLGLVSALSLPSGAWADCPKDPQRIVSLGGTITEIIYRLGEEGRIVAVDSTSSYPAASASLPKVGYFRQVAAEGVLSLNPDLVLADADAGPTDVLEQIEQAGICVLRAPDGGTIESILDRVRMVGKTLGVEEKATGVAEEIEAALSETATKIAAADGEPKILFLISIDAGTPMAAGTETEADDIIRLAGGVNAVNAFSGYKPLSPEVAAASQADYILVMDHTAQQAGGADRILSLPPLAVTPAGANGNLISMEGLLLLGFGPRTPEAVLKLASAIHPELSAE